MRLLGKLSSERRKELADRTAEEDEVALMRIRVSAHPRAGQLSCVLGQTDVVSLQKLFKGLGLAEAETPGLPGFSEARWCPGSAHLDSLLSGRKRSDSRLEEKVGWAREWLHRHVCYPIACGTSRRARKLVNDYMDMQASSSPASPMDVD